MDKNKIFIHFEAIDKKTKNPQNSNNTSQILENIELYIIWCLRYIEFKDYFINMNSKIEGELDLEAALFTGRKFLNNKGFEYIKKLDLSRKRTINAIRKVNHPHFLHCIKFSIDTYMEQEEYLPCVLLRDVRDLYLNKKDSLD